jgi:hypothetical protein
MLDAAFFIFFLFFYFLLSSFNLLFVDDAFDANSFYFINLSSSHIARVAVLYIPTFSDYFWNDEIMELFKDEDYQFYALEMRRYGRSLHLDQGHHPNLCFEVCEYYEEIGRAIHIMRIFDGMEKVLLFGHGSGAIIAANYINDHNELVDGFLAISPLVMLHTAFPGTIACCCCCCCCFVVFVVVVVVVVAFVCFV